MSRSIRRDGDEVIIRLSMADAQTLQVALNPIRQGETTSTSTNNLRTGLATALARVMSKGQ